MRSNRRKPTPNLSQPSDGGSFSAERKTSESTNPLRGLNITAEREIGTVGGIKTTTKLTVGVDELIGQQGLDIEIDATNRTAGFGAGIGSTKGKLGINIGGKIGYDEDGNLSVKGAEAGINIGGFGGSASIDEDEGVKGSVSAAGAKVEIGIDKDGKKSVSLCYGVPGGEICVTFESNEDIKTQTPTPSPSPTPTVPTTLENPLSYVPQPPIDADCKYWVKLFTSYENNWYNNKIVKSDSPDQETPDSYAANAVPLGTIYPHSGGAFYYIRTSSGVHERIFDKRNPNINQIIFESNYYSNPRLMYPINRTSVSFGRETTGYNNNGSPIFGEWQLLITQKYELKEVCDSFNPPPPPIDKIQLPNYPQHRKRMNCCDKVNEIYKYLGIAKLKKNKFPVSNAFLVPGGSGNDNCFDYYAIMQALFRMLANGLIINPKSKPLGSEWQNTNATAWASAMYEMMAESMSDGNSTQRFEVATIMQLTQMMATLAENGRKIEFVADAIGLEPLPVAENVPVCFTIYEGHKGFCKKEPKKINVSGLKTDDDVEKVLGKMLNPSLIPITAWKFRPGQISINEALRNKNG